MYIVRFDSILSDACIATILLELCRRVLAIYGTLQYRPSDERLSQSHSYTYSSLPQYTCYTWQTSSRTYLQRPRITHGRAYLQHPRTTILLLKQVGSVSFQRFVECVRQSGFAVVPYGPA